MRVTTDDGVGLEVDDAGSGPALLLVHGFGGAKEDFADHLDALAARHRRGHVRPPWPRRERRPDDSRPTRSTASPRTCSRVADAVGIDTFRCSATRWAGWSRAVSCSRTRSGSTRSCSWTRRRARSRGIDPELMDVGGEVALDEGKDGLKRLLDAAATLGTPAYERLLARATRLRGVRGSEVGSARSAVMWATMAREIARQPDQLALLAGVRCPTLVIVGEQDAPFLEGSRADGGHDPRRGARRDPGRRSLAAVREPGAVARRARAASSPACERATAA